MVATLILSLALIAPSTPAHKGDDTLIVPPMVQLGPRQSASERLVAIVWHASDEDHSYTLKADQGKQPLPVSVSYRTVNIEGYPSHRVYTATIGKYDDGTRIAYTLNSGENLLARGSFNAPKNDRQNYTFSVFGDFGISSPAEPRISYLTWLKHPDFVVLTGDLVYGEGRLSEYRKNLFPQYLSQVESPKSGSNLFGNAITIGVPGNHDILDRNFDEHTDLLAYFYYWANPLNGPLTEVGAKNTPTLTGPTERQQAFLAAAGANYPRMANFSFDYGNAHWTCLDANPYVDWTDPALRQWLKDDLAKAKNKTWRFVALHQPPFHSSKSHAGEKQIRPLADIFEDYKVDVVFGGHVHNYQRTYPIKVGPKRGASREELNRDDWPIDVNYDGIQNTHPKGVIYLVDGAGGASLYEPQYEQDRSKWLPFQQVYSGKFSSSFVTIAGRKFTLIQTDQDGNVVDKFTIEK